MRMNNPLPPIPDTASLTNTTSRDPGSDYVHVPMDDSPPAYSTGHGHDDNDEHEFNPSEFGVMSVPSSSSSASPPSSSSAGRRYRDSYRRPGHSHASNSGSRSRNVAASHSRRNPRSNSDSSTSSSASNDAGTQRLVREDAFI